LIVAELPTKTLRLMRLNAHVILVVLRIGVMSKVLAVPLTM